MSKRGQKTTSNEGSPMAKAKPTSLVKARPLSLVARNPRSDKNSSQDSAYLVNPENADERNEMKIASGSSWQSAPRSEVGYSQVSRQENVPIAAGNSIRKDQLQKQRDEKAHSNSNSTRKPVQGATPKTRVSEHEIHEPAIHDQDLSVLTKEVGNYSSLLNFFVEMVNVHVLVDESSQSSWSELCGKFGDL